MYISECRTVRNMKKSFRCSDELNEKILYYAVKKNLNISRAIIDLIQKGLEVKS